MATFKVAVVTGGGGGIGRAFSQRLAKEGAKVAVVDLDPDTAAQTAREIDGLALACDVGDESALTAMIDAVESRLGPIDLFVNKKQAAVIPILLPDCPPDFTLHLFLQQFTWVDFQPGIDDDDAQKRLMWAITGINPYV